MALLDTATFRELLRLSLPMVVSQGTFAVMVFTDRLFMSYIDATHIAAALGGGVAFVFTISLVMGLITYANALVAQYYGAGELRKCSRVTTQGIIIALCSTPLLVVAALGVGESFALLGHDPAQVAIERTYFYVLMWGAFFTLVKACMACYFTGIGRTRVVMIVDLAGAALNVPLSWVLIFGKSGLPALGISGAGLGTVVATLFSIFLYLYFYLGPEHRRQFAVDDAWRFDRAIMRRFLRLGAPSGLESFMNTATFNVFLLLFQSYGVVQGAAMAIVFNWDILSFIPMMGLNIGVMSLIGRFVGAADMARARQVIVAGFTVAFAYSGTLALFFLLFRGLLVAVFATPDADFAQIQALAEYMMVGLVTYMLADATILIAGGVLRGAGDTRWIMITSTSVHWVMLVAQYLIIVEYQMGPKVSWWLFVAMLLVLAAIYVMRLASNRWRQPERLAQVMRE